MLLDLNVDAFSMESACDETDPDPFGRAANGGDDSGTSSSVVIADDPPSSAVDESNSSRCHSPSTLAFSILKTSQVIEVEDEKNVAGSAVTRQLLPVAIEPFLSSSWPPPPPPPPPPQQPKNWLKLSAPETGRAAEVGIYEAQPRHQPIKKSRRGPRSRSSQYRGVTFYRRTGRWESHIWSVHKSIRSSCVDIYVHIQLHFFIRMGYVYLYIYCDNNHYS